MKTKRYKLTTLICSLLMIFSSCGSVSPQSVKITEFSFELTSNQIEVGNSCLIKDENILPAHATNKTIRYHVENETIAVFENGLITGLSAGNTLVIGETTDGSGLTYSVALNVIDNRFIPVNKIDLSFYSYSFEVGDSFSPTVDILPLNATDKEYTFDCSPESCRKVCVI